MNNSTNYGHFIDLLINSDDDYEPYGMAAPSTVYGPRGIRSEYCSAQEASFSEDSDMWIGE